MNDDLETALRDLGTRVAVPTPPDLTGAVLSRLDRPTRRRSRLVAAALTALVALAAALAASPAVRAAVSDLLRIGGVEIHENRPPPTIPATTAPPRGPRVSLPEARAATDFPLALPTGLGEPTTVLLLADAHVVSMAFDSPRGELRLDQFDGTLDPMFEKFASAQDVVATTVAGHPAVWVGRPHPVLFDTADGTLHEEQARLAGTTLIWEREGVTYRLEGPLTRFEATAIAESLR